MQESVPLQTLEWPDSELILALAAPVGTDLNSVSDQIKRHLADFGYKTNHLKLSRLLDRIDPNSLGVRVRQKPEFARISSHMDAGNALRSKAGRGDLLALHAVSEISLARKTTSGNKFNSNEPLPSTAHVLDSLKHPDEVTALRKIYGPGFFLIGVYSPQLTRKRNLINLKDLSPSEADKLIERDEAETQPFGQQTRDTFFLADVFVHQNGGAELRRFLDLVFGHPYHTPTPDENAMFLAHAAALRSADLSRQVGAVIVSASGEVISTGANDVPKGGGGQYWPKPFTADQRDYVLGFDSNKRVIGEIARDTLKRALPDMTERRRAAALRTLGPGQLYDLTEFGRAVHAEMEAIIACARSGVSMRNGTLYATTFPCHNCAKHIVGAGIKKVLYVEPYPGP